MAVDPGSGEVQLVVFQLAHELYGADIAVVREIVPLQRITRVPRTPRFVRGVTNLRGRVIPVIDLRVRLDLPVGETTKQSRIAVVEMEGGTVGMIVDGVSEVLRVRSQEVEPPSPVIADKDSDHIRGVVKVDERLISLLDLGRVLARDAERKVV